MTTAPEGWVEYEAFLDWRRFHREGCEWGFHEARIYKYAPDKMWWVMPPGCTTLDHHSGKSLGPFTSGSAAAFAADLLYPK